MIEVLKNKYPNISQEEIKNIDADSFNKMSITLLESLIKDCKDMLQDVFKTSKEYKCSQEDLEWLKDFLRERKNYLEICHKETVAIQKNLREGLNPPKCYKF